MHFFYEKFYLNMFFRYIMSSSHSWPGRFTWDLGRWEKICEAFRMSDMPLFQSGVIQVPRTAGSPNSLIYSVHTKPAKCQYWSSSYVKEFNSIFVSPYSGPHEHCQATVAWTSGRGRLTNSIFPTITSCSVLSRSFDLDSTNI